MPENSGQSESWRAELKELLEMQRETKDATQSLIRDSLETSLKALQDSNQALRDALNADWKNPKKVFYLVTGIAALFFGVNLANDYLGASALKDRADFLSQQSQHGLADLKDLKQSKEALDQELKNSKLLQQQTVQTNNTTVRVLSLVSRGQVQLTLWKSPEQALRLADRARDELNRLRSTVEVLPDVRGSLDDLEELVLLLRAEGLLAQETFIEAKETADLILKFRPESREAHLYRGLAGLHWAGRLQQHAVERQGLLDGAAESLDRAIARGPSPLNFARIYLVAAHFDRGNFDDCVRTAKTHLSQFPESKEGRARLDSKIRAEIALVESFRDLSLFVLGRKPKLECFSCCVAAGDVGLSDSVLYETILGRAVKRRNQLTNDPHAANELGMFCIPIIESLRKISLAAECGCSGEPEVVSTATVSKDSMAEFGLGVGPDLVPVSRDKKLGKIIEGALHMQYLVEDTERMQRIRTEGNKEVAYTVEFKKYRYEVRTYDDPTVSIDSLPYVLFSEEREISGHTKPGEPEGAVPEAPTKNVRWASAGQSDKDDNTPGDKR